MNYYDILFARKMAGGQGEITTEGLSVTENGTYTAPEGKAYTPVVVNVSGYKIKDIPNTPTAIATFNASALPMPSLKVGIEPIQEGSGDPSPTNIRPISGWSAVDVTRCGKNLFDKVNCGVYNGYIAGAQVYSSPSHRTIYFPCKPNTTYSSANFSGNGRNDITYSSEVPRSGLVVPTPLNTITTNENAKYILYYCYNTISDTVTFDDVKNAIDIELGSVVPDTYSAYNGHTYTIDLDGTRYGGKLDVVNGVLTITNEIKKVNILEWYYSHNTFFSASIGISADGSPDINSDFVCSFAKPVNKEWYQLSNNECTLRKNLHAEEFYSLCVKNTEYTDATDFKNSLDSTSEITFPLATPQTIQLTSTAIKSLLGNNNIWADTGDVLEGSYFKEL